VGFLPIVMKRRYLRSLPTLRLPGGQCRALFVVAGCASGRVGQGGAFFRKNQCLLSGLKPQVCPGGLM